MDDDIVLERDEDIAAACFPFKISADITTLTLRLGSVRDLPYFAQALKKNTSILHVRIKHSPCRDPINPLFAALSASNSVKELTVECFSRELVDVVGSHLEFSPVKSLHIEGYDVEALNSQSLFEGLLINTTLTLITFKNTPASIRDLNKLNKLVKEVIFSLRKNCTVSDIVVKTAPLHSVARELGLASGFEISPWDKPMLEHEASYFGIYIERTEGLRRTGKSIPQSSTSVTEVQNVQKPQTRASIVDEYLQNKNYEALKRYIEKHCGQSVLHGLYSEDLDLYAKTFADSLSAKVIQQKLDKNKKKTAKLRNEIEELEVARKQMIDEREALKNRLALVEEKTEELNETIETIVEDLNERLVAQENLEVNLMMFQVSREKNEPELNRWREKLQTDISTWTCDDLSFLMKEIGLGKFSQIFYQKDIDGTVLEGLDASDWKSMGLPFKEYKRLQLYLFLAKHTHDIYTVPTVMLNASCEAVCKWLADRGFQQLVEVFRKENITGSELVFLEKADLQAKLKIQDFRTQVKLMNEITKLKEGVIAELAQ